MFKLIYFADCSKNKLLMGSEKRKWFYVLVGLKILINIPAAMKLHTPLLQEINLPSSARLFKNIITEVAARERAGVKLTCTRSSKHRGEQKVRNKLSAQGADFIRTNVPLKRSQRRWTIFLHARQIMLRI